MKCFVMFCMCLVCSLFKDELFMLYWIKMFYIMFFVECFDEVVCRLEVGELVVFLIEIVYGFGVDVENL